MESVGSIVRIAVLHPFEPGSDESDSILALNRIGAEVELLRSSDLKTCLAHAAQASLDVVVLDRCSRAWVEKILEELVAEGPPVVVVVPEDATEQDSFDVFRHGAADCVRFGQDYGEVLPLVVLEQVRRWRQLRDRTETHDKLLWLEKLNEAIVSELPVSLAVADKEGRVVDVNPEFSRVFGVPGRLALGRPILELLPLDLVENVGLEGLLDSTVSEVEGVSQVARSVDSEGRSRVFDLRSRPLDDRGHTLLAFTDVTQTDSLSRRLGEAERYNANIIQSINSALLVVGLDGRVTFANSTAAEILGTDVESLIGRSVDEWFLSGDRPTSLIGRTLSQGLRFKGQETMIRTEMGVSIPVGVSCTPLADAGTRVEGAVAIFQDLTEIKQLQRQVLQQEKMASIGELAAGIAHEINNPVGFIHANLSQMTEYLGELGEYLEAVNSLRQAFEAEDLSSASMAALRSLNELNSRLDVDFLRKDFGSAVRESLEGSDRIRHIVSDLRDFSHKGTAERTPANVNQCVDTTANIVWTMMKHSVELKKEYDDLPDLLCYPMELKQVFMNLLVNAYQAIEEKLQGGEGIGLIRIQTHRRQEGIEVSISDTGTGVSEADVRRIFDPFYTTKEVGMGTGLGLSTSYGIVKRHGGQISVESPPGEGARFTVWLPFEVPAEALDLE
ncbi:MAG: hypothetical protein CL917_02850 [Deltaproteobacteria bacterium]|nr:hypothetical protein [Deltaproteobacteria bacterium]